jgi:hypothetical protein
VMTVDREWNLRKGSFESRFKTFGLDAGRALSDLRTHSLPSGDAGQLIDDFDAARAKAWSGATSPLNPYQVEKLDKLRDRDENGNKTAMSSSPPVAVVDATQFSKVVSQLGLRPSVNIVEDRGNSSEMRQDLADCLANLNDRKLSTAQRNDLVDLIRKLRDALKRQDSGSLGPRTQIPQLIPNARARLIPLWHGKPKAELLDIARREPKTQWARIKKTISDH